MNSLLLEQIKQRINFFFLFPPKARISLATLIITLEVRNKEMLSKVNVIRLLRCGFQILHPANV